MSGRHLAVGVFGAAEKCRRIAEGAQCCAGVRLHLQAGCVACLPGEAVSNFTRLVQRIPARLEAQPGVEQQRQARGEAGVRLHAADLHLQSIREQGEGFAHAAGWIIQQQVRGGDLRGDALVGIKAGGAEDESAGIDARIGSRTPAELPGIRRAGAHQHLGAGSQPLVRCSGSLNREQIGKVAAGIQLEDRQCILVCQQAFGLPVQVRVELAGSNLGRRICPAGGFQQDAQLTGILAA